MGQELSRRTPATPARQPEPSWPAVASTTVRLWLERHHRYPVGRRRRLVFVLSALVAMALGAGVTLAFTQRGPEPAVSQVQAAPCRARTRCRRRRLTVTRRRCGSPSRWPRAWSWAVTRRCATSCSRAASPRVSSWNCSRRPLIPEGSLLVVATPVIRNQFGTRLASVYAPLVIASFGSGAERVDVRYVAPGGTAAFESQLAADRKNRICRGRAAADQQARPGLRGRAPGASGRTGGSAPAYNAFSTCSPIVT